MLLILLSPLSVSTGLACGKAYDASVADGGVTTDASTDAASDEAALADVVTEPVDAADAADAAEASACDLSQTDSDPENCGVCGNVCATKTCAGGVCDRLVFTTALTHNGSLGGLLGADKICQDDATTAGVKGAFKAWLSLGTGIANVNGRFVKSTTPYRRRDGIAIAMSYAQLVGTGGVLAPLGMTATGTSLPNPGFAWTDTGQNGSDNGTGDCNGWNTGAGGTLGNTGDLTSLTASWTQSSSRSCDMLGRLVCFEQ